MAQIDRKSTFVAHAKGSSRSERFRGIRQSIKTTTKNMANTMNSLKTLVEMPISYMFIRYCALPPITA